MRLSRINELTVLLGPRKLDFTCCDIEPAIIARNLLVLSALLEDTSGAWTDALWNVCYHLYLDATSLKAPGHQVANLLAASSSLDQWRQSAYAPLSSTSVMRRRLPTSAASGRSIRSSQYQRPIRPGRASQARDQEV